MLALLRACLRDNDHVLEMIMIIVFVVFVFCFILFAFVLFCFVSPARSNMTRVALHEE